MWQHKAVAYAHISRTLSQVSWTGNSAWKNLVTVYLCWTNSSGIQHIDTGGSTKLSMSFMEDGFKPHRDVFQEMKLGNPLRTFHQKSCEAPSSRDTMHKSRFVMTGIQERTFFNRALSEISIHLPLLLLYLLLYMNSGPLLCQTEIYSGGRHMLLQINQNFFRSIAG